MSRTLKFRAWDNIDKKWLFGYGYKSLGGFNLIGEVVLMGELNSVSLERWNDISIDQFTGFKDKNGKEVYEGDIVEAIFNHHGKETELKFNAKIIYNSNVGRFQISYPNINKHFVSDDIHWKYFIEVIGNIHENPELL